MSDIAAEPTSDGDDGDVVVEVTNLYKVFGPNPSRVFALLEKGVSKEEILAKTGCTVAVHDASFRVRRGEIFVIMGLSGSGKSTLIRCINRLIEVTRGHILIAGKDIVELDKHELIEMRRSTLSMVFQHFGLLPHRSVLSNVEYGLEISGVEREERHKRAMNAIEQVGLKGYEESMPSELSGGMQQRVGLARALANNASILLMDEAFSALDPLVRTQMQDDLIDLQTRLRKTILFITHDLDEALKLGDRIAILGPGGRIIQIGSPEEILTKPADEYVERFVRNVDRSTVLTAGAIMRKSPTITVPKDGIQVAARRMEKDGVQTLYAVDNARRLRGVVRIDDVIKLQKQKCTDLEPAIIDDIYTTGPQTLIRDLLPTLVKTTSPIAVLDDQRRFLGVVDRASILSEIHGDSDEEAVPLSDVIQNGEAANSDETAGSDEPAGSDETAISEEA